MNERVSELEQLRAALLSTTSTRVGKMAKGNEREEKSQQDR